MSKSNLLPFSRTSTRKIADSEAHGEAQTDLHGIHGVSDESNEWNRTLVAQTRYMLGQDLALYRNIPAWHAAKSVLELGCGNGAHLHLVSRTYPDKTYVGLDISEPLLDIARNENRSPSVSYEHGDLFAMDASSIGRFDFIIARFLVQHLASAGSFLRRCTQLLNPGGTLLVYDAHDEGTYLYPEVAERLGLFAELARVQGERCIGRDAVLEIAREAWHYGFAILGTRELAHVAVTIDQKRALRDLLASIFTTIQICMDVEKDTERTIAALERWLALPHGFGQFGTRAVILTLRTAGAYTLSGRR